jgi:hypothetical protein
MDQRAHDVEEDLKNILHTRLALADKIDMLERQVKATVESTKMAALDALDLARHKAAGFIESTTHHLNPSVQARRRPWIMVGGAIALGLFAGIIEQRRRASGVYRYYPPAAGGADVMPEDGQSQEPRGVYPFYGREKARPRTSRFRFDDRSEGGGSESAQTAMPEILKPLRSLWDELRVEVTQEPVAERRTSHGPRLYPGSGPDRRTIAAGSVEPVRRITRLPPRPTSDPVRVTGVHSPREQCSSFPHRSTSERVPASLERMRPWPNAVADGLSRSSS